MKDKENFPSEEEKKIEEKEVKSFFRKKLWLKIILFFVILIFLIFGGIFGISLNFINTLKPEKTIVEQRLQDFKTAIKEQNLQKTKETSQKAQADIKRIQEKVQKYRFFSSFPFLKTYYQDLNHGLNAAVAGLKTVDLVVDTITPYADILGLSGGDKEKTQGKTTLDRVTFVVTTLDKLRPELENISQELETARKEIDQINPDAYPEEVAGIRLRDKITQAISLLDEASGFINNAKPLLEVMPEIMGVSSPRYYFLLSQNDAELRPTGGFMTAYGILKVDKGKITPILSEDIYSLDAAWGKKLPPPEPIKKYHKNVFYYYIRDMNLSPDFAESIKPIIDIYQNQIPGAYKVNGVIAVDTKFLASLIKVLGTIGVPEWGNFSAEIDKRCDCPQVVYRLEELADKPVSTLKTSRKAVIAPLMHSILANAFNSPKEKIGELFSTVLTSIREKHILIYLLDEKEQKAVEAFNLGGRVRNFEEGDYQLLVDANFAGAKSNLFIKQKIEERIEVGPEGEITKSVVITYNNPYPPSDCNLLTGGLCLNGLYRNWFRFYVPKGSVLLEMTGSEVEPLVYEDLGKTVFEGFFGDKFPLRPQSMAKVSLKYKLPFKYESKKPYKLLIQKQPGVEKYDMVVEFNGQKQEFELREDKELVFQ